LSSEPRRLLWANSSIRGADGRSPVRHQEGGATAAQFPHRFPDFFFRGRVHGAGRVIEKDDPRLNEQGAGDGNALALASAQGDTALSDDGVVALRQFADESVCPGRPGRCLDLAPGSLGASEGDVLREGRAEEEGLLEDHADSVA
jgi:hypothetical protein